MSNENEISDSLEICRKLQNDGINAGTAAPFDGSDSVLFGMDPDVVLEIDKILNQERENDTHVADDELSVSSVLYRQAHGAAPQTSEQEILETEALVAETPALTRKNPTQKRKEEPLVQASDILTQERNRGGFVLDLEEAAPSVADNEIGFEVPDEEEAEEEYRERHPVLRSFLNILICVAAALCLSLLITKFVAHHTSVEGSSMNPTLSNGDQLIVENVSYYFHEPERFDIVVFPVSENTNYIKRIIGIPGDCIRIQDGSIYINDELLQEPYSFDPIEDAGIAEDEIILSAGKYFVLGDNRNESKDSRSSEVGVIDRSQIQGKAWIRFYPFSQMSLIQ